METMGKGVTTTAAALPGLFDPARRYIGAELEKAKASGDTSSFQELHEAQQLLDEAIGKVISLAHHHDDLNCSLQECAAELESLRLKDVDVDVEMLDRAAKAVRASEAFKESLVAGSANAVPDYIDFDAAAWGLYDAPGADEVAVDLNRTINDAIAAFYLRRALGVPKAQAEADFSATVSAKRHVYAAYGAEDVWVGESIARVIQSVVNTDLDSRMSIGVNAEADVNLHTPSL